MFTLSLKRNAWLWNIIVYTLYSNICNTFKRHYSKQNGCVNGFLTVFGHCNHVVVITEAYVNKEEQLLLKYEFYLDFSNCVLVIHLPSFFNNFQFVFLWLVIRKSFLATWQFIITLINFVNKICFTYFLKFDTIVCSNENYVM